MARPSKRVIRRRALRILQEAKRPLYLFTLRADEIFAIADLSRISRDKKSDLVGYQRFEVQRHVDSIQTYLDENRGEILFPNALILSLSSAVAFRPERGSKVDEGLAEAGTIEIPIPEKGEPRLAWIVDGQQRALALSRCKRRDFPVPISAFVADDVHTQREQFLLINSTKPLPRGLITELLPQINIVLPPNLANCKAPAVLCDLLNRDAESPFFGLIRRASSRGNGEQTQVLTDTSIVQVLQHSLLKPAGCLYLYRNAATGKTDFRSILRLLKIYWGAVKATFPEAWGLPPAQSRLMHSAGLRAMGRLMDRVMRTVDILRPDVDRHIRRELAPLVRVCRWTSGSWDELGLRWNEIQNVSAHVRLLTDLLLRTYHDSRKESL
jgi:DGQHR domain-containing protein